MEIIKYICPIILVIFSIFAIAFAFIILWSENRKDTENKLLIVFCFSSAIWSLGFGALILQTEAELAYQCRVFGMIGTIMYLATGQILISYLSNIKKLWANVYNIFAGLGIFVYFLTVERSQTIYQLDSSGMTYSFKPGLASTIYTSYSVILALLMFGISLYMCFSKTKRIRFFGKIFMAADIIMLLGTILDTVFPLMGIPAIPGSTMTQFLGVVVVYVAIRANNRSKINIANMSEFVYYSLSMPVLVYSPDGCLQIANDAAAKFLNISREQIPEKETRLGTLFDVDDASVFDFGGTNKNTDATCIHNGIFCNLAINRIQDHYNDVIGYIIIVTDLSERMKNLQRLEDAKLEAEAANRAKTAFLANMSHEIRTPMNAILGFSELILKQDISDNVRECVSDIRSSCLNLLAIINDILDISKLDSGKQVLTCSNYHTATLLQDVYHIIDIQAKKKGLTFEMNTDPRIPNELYGDLARVRGILINLLNNAVKYTKEGSIVFGIRLLNVRDKTASLEYSITDTGIGLKEESLLHLFDSFARFDTQRNSNIEGSGLGLAIVKGYVNLMNGTIKVDSIYGRGTTFTVTLSQEIVDDSPINLTKPNEQTDNSLNENELKIRDVRVLVTDDNQINLKVIKSTLEYYGLTVDTAPSGKDALRLCEQTQYDLIFMDQMMPVMDGIQTMKKIRSLPSYTDPTSCKIIALTANAIIGVRNELMDKGFDEYLSKPIKFQELERVLRLFIPQSKFESGNASACEIRLPLNRQQLENMIPQIDVAAGLAHCNDNLNLYLDILQMLYQSAPEQLETLRTLKGQKDYPNYVIHIHGIKSQLLNIGYSLLAQDAKALEMAGKESRFDYIEENTESFIASYEELLKQLERL